MTGSKSPAQRTGCGVSILQLLVVLLIAGALFVLLSPSLAEPPEAADRRYCRQNLKQIGLALHNYYDDYGCFPPAIIYGSDGRPWHSWRTLILPYLEEQDVYDRYRFDEPWNGPHNSRLAAEAGLLPFFHCRADEKAPTGETSYVAVTGDGTLWRRDRTLSFDDVPDGLSNTILVVELSDSGVHWMEPRDLPLNKMTFEIGAKQGVGIRGRHGGTERWLREDDPTFANVLLADGSVLALGGPDLKPATVRSLLLRDDGAPEEDWYPRLVLPTNDANVHR